MNFSVMVNGMLDFHSHAPASKTEDAKDLILVYEQLLFSHVEKTELCVFCSTIETPNLNWPLLQLC